MFTAIVAFVFLCIGLFLERVFWALVFLMCARWAYGKIEKATLRYRVAMAPLIARIAFWRRWRFV